MCNTDVSVNYNYVSGLLITSLLQACPDGAPDFRDVQCADTNILPFNGEFYRWEAFTGPGQ